MFGSSHKHKAGSFAKRIQADCYVTDTVFETKRGDLGIVLSVTGIDPECRTEDQLDQFSRRLESALRVLDDRFRLYQYIIKRSNPEIPSRGEYANPAATAAVSRRIEGLRGRAKDLYSIDLYAVILYEGFHVAGFGGKAEVVEGEAVESIQVLQGAVRSFCELVDDILPMRILPESEATRLFWRRLYNYDGVHAGSYRQGQSLTPLLCDAQIDINRDHLVVNDHYVKAVGLKHVPAKSIPNLLGDLLKIPCDLVVCTEWKAQSNLHMRRVIKRKRTMWDGMKVHIPSLLMLGRGVPKSELPKRAEVEEHEDDLGEAMKEIENKGNFFGAYATTVLLIHKTLTQVRDAVSSATKVFGRWDASVIDERWNLFPAFLAIAPGNYCDQVRYHYLVNADFANMALIWNSFTGNPRNAHLNDEYLALFETSDQQLFYFNGHVGGVFGASILGAPETGKSFLTNYLAAQMQKYDPITLILDIGGSYRDITAEFGGSYFEIGMERRPRINPFALANTELNRQFLYQFIRLLVGHDTTAAPDVQAVEEKRIYEAIEAMYYLPGHLRRLGNLALPGMLNARLMRWKDGGQYGAFFDHAENDVELGNFSTFEFQGMEKFTDVMTPLCFLITQLFNDRVFYPGYLSRVKVQIFDECWRFMLMSELGEHLASSLKTGRKHNLCNIFTTQSGLDAERTQFGALMREACPMTIFLANPKINKANYRALFDLTEPQVDRIAGLKPKRELAIATPNYFKVVELKIDNERDRMAYSNDPNTNLVKQASALSARA